MTRAAHFLKSIARSGIGGADAGGLESTGSTKLPDKIVLKDQIGAEAAYIEQMLGQPPDEHALADLASNARDGLDRLDADGEEAELSDDHLMGLEAVIRSDGTRPVAFVIGDFIDTAQPSIQASEWQFDIAAVETNVRRLCKATGRVDDPSQNSLGYQGTAFLVGPGLVMTNRHVLRAITNERDPDNGTLKDDIVIDFARELGSSRNDRRYPVTSILFRGLGGDGQWLQDNGINFDTLDIAILEIDSDAGELPPPLPLRFGEAVHYAVRGRKACVVGFPGATKGLAPDVFDRVFSGIKAFKRLAPGEILEAAGEGEVDGDPRNWIMTHDASTLGGNSGSPILDLESTASPLLGIHFAGLPDRRNWAHSFERLGEVLAEVPDLNIVSG